MKIIKYLLLILLITGCTAKTTVESYLDYLEDVTVLESELKKNVSYTGYQGFDNTLILAIQNDNMTTIRHLVTKVIFYDENNDEICSDSKFTFFLDAKEERLMSFTCMKMEDVKSYDVNFIVEEMYHYDLISLKDMLVFNNKSNDESISVNVSNKKALLVTKAEIEVIFYENGNVVAINTSIIRDIKKGDNKIINVKIPQKENEYVKYDSFSVQINYAY